MSKQYFTLTYDLLEKTSDGSYIPFSRTHGIETANVVASSADEAISDLKESFNMLSVNVRSVSDPKMMTDEEYENG